MATCRAWLGHRAWKGPNGLENGREDIRVPLRTLLPVDGWQVGGSVGLSAWLKEGGDKGCRRSEVNRRVRMTT